MSEEGRIPDEFAGDFTSPTVEGLMTVTDIASVVADHLWVSVDDVYLLTEQMACEVVANFSECLVVGGEVVVRSRYKRTPFGTRQEHLVAALYTTTGAQRIFSAACMEYDERQYR